LRSDPDAKFDQHASVDVSTLKPMITWGTNPEQAVAIDDKIPSLADLPDAHRRAAEKALEYVALSEGSTVLGLPIDWAFVGSCTNGRIEDLRIVAKVLQGKKVKAGVTLYIVPGSEAVLKQAQQEGLDRIFQEAGAQYRMPGCSMCLGMNEDKVPPGARCISTSNRNFVGRQGPGSRTHLASPATVAASAIEGRVTSPVGYL
jgi:3-isopropylmalate/(R)-2-methylmalate dehydratase large subunit